MSPHPDLLEILRRGGEQRVELLRFCVQSVTMEPVFVFLAQEYRRRPTHAGALALYDIFCARDAVARIGVTHALPPWNLQLHAAVAAVREQRMRQHESPRNESRGFAVTTPHRNLFDQVTDAVQNDPNGRFAALHLRYDPSLTSQQNLPWRKDECRAKALPGERLASRGTSPSRHSGLLADCEHRMIVDAMIPAWTAWLFFAPPSSPPSPALGYPPELSASNHCLTFW